MCRGPAKGYIEGLEHRLHDAESLLLQLLPHISTEQLHAATSFLASNEIEDTGRTSPDRRGSPPILNKKTGIEYWENFPLTSVDGVQRWQRDCEVHSTNENNHHVKPEHRNSSPGSRMVSDDSNTSKKKRQSMAEHKQPSSYIGDVNTLNDLLGLQNNQSASAQAIQAQNEQIRLALDQQRRQNSWQDQISQSTSQAGRDSRLHQRQIFGQNEYFDNSNLNSWQPQQGNMNMDVLNRDSDQPNAIPAVTTQTHSHLFW